jgi:hypothetical protein
MQIHTWMRCTPLYRHMPISCTLMWGIYAQPYMRCTTIRRCASEILTGANNALNPIRQLFLTTKTPVDGAAANSCLIGCSALLALVSISAAHLRIWNAQPYMRCTTICEVHACEPRRQCGTTSALLPFGTPKWPRTLCPYMRCTPMYVHVHTQRGQSSHLI